MTSKLDSWKGAVQWPPTPVVDGLAVPLLHAALLQACELGLGDEAMSSSRHWDKSARTGWWLFQWGVAGSLEGLMGGPEVAGKVQNFRFRYAEVVLRRRYIGAASWSWDRERSGK